MIPHILIIDPDAAAAQVTRALLTRVVPTATVVFEPTIAAARRRVQERPPDIVLLDGSANQLADARLIREARALNPAVQIIALAGREPRAAQRLLALQLINGVLEKSSAPEAFVWALNRVIDHARAARGEPWSQKQDEEAITEREHCVRATHDTGSDSAPPRAA